MAENIKPIKLFSEMNDITVNWKKLRRLIPEDEARTNDRAYTKEEIIKLLESADLRGKCIVLLLASSGIRIGAIPWLKIKHLESMIIDGKLVAGKVTVYAQTKNEYTAFITRECYNTIHEYLQYRLRHGEKNIDGNLSPEAPLIRDAMNTVTRRDRTPRSIVARSLEDYLRRLCYKSGIKVKTGKRGQVATAHGFRKYFNTTAKDNAMDGLHKEMLLGHSTGLEDSYYRPVEEKLLHSYLSVANKLTFNDAQLLRHELAQLQQRTRQIHEAEDRNIKKLARFQFHIFADHNGVPSTCCETCNETMKTFAKMSVEELV
jgi:hypothetical protein